MADLCYQLSSRFASAWKVANLGVPVVLVCLGFLNAVEMPQTFQDHAGWERRLREYTDGCESKDGWNPKAMINGTPLIRSFSVTVRTSARSQAEGSL